MPALRYGGPVPFDSYYLLSVCFFLFLLLVLFATSCVYNQIIKSAKTLLFKRNVCLLLLTCIYVVVLFFFLEGLHYFMLPLAGDGKGKRATMAVNADECVSYRRCRAYRRCIEKTKCLSVEQSE